MRLAGASKTFVFLLFAVLAPLPLDRAQDVYRWADLGTVVVVIDSLNDLHTHLHPKLHE